MAIIGHSWWMTSPLAWVPTCTLSGHPLGLGAFPGDGSCVVQTPHYGHAARGLLRLGLSARCMSPVVYTRAPQLPLANSSSGGSYVKFMATPVVVYSLGLGRAGWGWGRAAGQAHIRTDAGCCLTF